MRFGLFSNGQRRNSVARTSYEEDLQEVVLADALGIDEAWISEHGPGIRALPNFRPLQVAIDARCAIT